MPTWPSPRSEQLGTPNPPRNPFHAGQVFRGFPIHAFATACQVARSPVRIRPTRSAPGSFYFQASNGSVALPVAGYDYNSDWTPLLAGLSPARMAASLAAPEPYVRLSRIRLVWGFPCQGCITPLFVVLLLHSFVRPAPRAFFRPDRILPSPSRAAMVKDGAFSAPPKACP